MQILVDIYSPKEQCRFISRLELTYGIFIFCKSSLGVGVDVSLISLTLSLWSSGESSEQVKIRVEWVKKIFSKFFAQDIIFPLN